ncbi:DUF4843 domain-containing protein [Porphyromonas sp.]|uniref:DUF4843 domain-containing protein n=1 Tax=Porphyromonas sp. TaxID=1924944 RepID=UPI0026DAE8C9|nr:DUF4843 domain-containing protein [Porphyromonas sp.]MDO4770639.1 DUF4843 domain-containing protein [Porphyromonas sp.]
MNIIRGCLPFLFIALLSSCTQVEPSVFDSKCDSARFPHRREKAPEAEGYDVEKQAFLSSFSFIDVNMPKEHTISIPLVLSGNPAPRERKVTVETIAEESNAPKEAYKILSAVIFADTVVGEVKLQLYNLPELKENTYTLSLKIKDSSDLRAGPSEDTKAVFTWNATIPIPTASALIMSYNMLINSSIDYNSTSDDFISTRALEVIAECFNWYDLDDVKKWGAKANDASVGKYKYLLNSYWLGAGGAQRLYAKRLAAFIKDYNAKHPDAPLVHNSGTDKGKPIQARKY